MGKVRQLAQKSLIFLITCYRYSISPILGQHCRFYPNCSEYAQTAIKQYGILQGLYSGLKRILRCHPWHPGGVDPVPEKPILEK